MNPRHVTVREVRIGNDLPLVLIAGPCALESRAHALEVSAALVEITDYLDCVMVKRDGCEADFNAKEQKRRQGDKKAIKLD